MNEKNKINEGIIKAWVMDSIISNKFNMKNWYKSRTLWLAVIMGASGVVVALESQFPTLGWLLVVKALLDASLRLVTTEPLS